MGTPVHGIDPLNTSGAALNGFIHRQVIILPYSLQARPQYAPLL